MYHDDDRKNESFLVIPARSDVIPAQAGIQSNDLPPQADIITRALEMNAKKPVLAGMGTELNSVPFLTWARANLFSSALNTALTLACVCLIVMIGIPLVNWLFIDAYWSGTTPADCPDKSAACWPFVRARFDQFMYGLYPEAERWRIHLGLGLIILAAVPLFIPRFPGKRWLLPLLVIACPLLGAGLFLGGVFGLVYVETGRWGGFFSP